MTAITDKQFRIIALVDTSDTDRLRQVVQVAAIVRFARVDLRLAVVVANKSQRATVAHLESAFNVPGLCEIIEMSDFSVELLRGFDLALAPAGPIAETPILTAVKACGLPIIAQESAVDDLGSDVNCITVPTNLNRHFASALYQALTLPGISVPGITMGNGG